jgi:class 3 adenylate cyclase
MAVAMQSKVQGAMAGWRSREHRLGFGVGMAAGPATVGQIGYEGRADYTALGDVVNRASRLCASAEDGQILLDRALADAVQGKMPFVAIGDRSLKGYDHPVQVYAAGWRAATPTTSPAAVSRPAKVSVAGP